MNLQQGKYLFQVPKQDKMLSEAVGGVGIVGEVDNWKKRSMRRQNLNKKRWTHQWQTNTGLEARTGER